MKQLFYFISLLVAIQACAPSQNTKKIDYLGEKGQVDYYNFDHDNWPIAVVIPAVFNSQIGTKEIERLAKGRRLVIIHFLSAKDRVRVLQVDGMERRITYYTDVISQTERAYGSMQFLLAEGLNATVGAKIITNVNFGQAVFINAWKPSIKMQLVANCYASPNAQCDSLTQYLKIGGRESVDGLLQDIDSGLDRLYGNYAMRMWQQMIDYQIDSFLPAKKCPIHWVYTTNTGLITKEKANASQNVDLYSLKEFKKLKDLLNN